MVECIGCCADLRPVADAGTLEVAVDGKADVHRRAGARCQAGNRRVQGRDAARYGPVRVIQGQARRHIIADLDAGRNQRPLVGDLNGIGYRAAGRVGPRRGRGVHDFGQGEVKDLLNLDLGRVVVVFVAAVLAVFVDRVIVRQVVGLTRLVEVRAVRGGVHIRLVECIGCCADLRPVADAGALESRIYRESNV